MDTLTLLVVAALVCAIILFEVNKRENAKITNFFNGDKIALLVDADQKVATLLRVIHNTSEQCVSESSRQYLSEQLTRLTESYERNEMTLTDYHTALNQLIGNHFNLGQLSDNYSVNY
ncbi:hypothetical protein DJ568_14795 [Mucilaginibacter hurinus]|uniref:Uncharacterized protein n=1 Tax=Mucilaginibacter hurinus TaxID=2201324 RepID=A0A367GKY4_9SPHI|nr:hypothetical protein [Mucilaginibacter hurinus]RCH54144.1 hypothetical protein DJ568_14795 [Mucilaginibacter hurinus]